VRKRAFRRAWPLVASALLGVGVAVAADSFKDVQYVSGKAGFAKKVSGVLTIDEHAVSFSDEHGKPLFSIPMADIDKSEAGTQREDGSFGRKMALGIFASHTDEFLQVQTHNAAGAEGVVFKVKKQTGAGMAAKINYWSGKAKAADPNAKPAEPPPND
jgi:hypothetical protein